MTTNENAVAKLNRLIEVNADRQEGYMKARENTDDPSLKSLFEQNAIQSGKNVADLELAVEGYGGVANNHTSIAGDVYRAWMDVKDAVSTNARKTVLASCERGEDTAVSTYEKILADEHDIDNNMLGTITRQKQEISKAHDQIKSLRDSA